MLFRSVPWPTTRCPAPYAQPMSFHGEFQATYQNGVLRPGSDLGLPEGAKVTLALRDQQPTPESRKQAWDLIDRIRREGLIRLRGNRWTRDDLYDRR